MRAPGDVGDIVDRPGRQDDRLRARRSVVTVEEIVDVLAPRAQAVVLPSWTVDYIAHAPGGAHPSYALGYSQRDNDYYVAWDAISRDRERFVRWLKTDVFGAPDPPGLAGAGAGEEG